MSLESSSFPFFLKCSSSNISRKSTILKWHRRTPKIRRLQRIQRRSRQRFPRNQRLLATFLGTKPHLVINWPDAKVGDECACPRAQEKGTAIPVSVGGGANGEDVVGTCGG